MYLSIERQREIDKKIDEILLGTGMSFPENSIGELLDKLGISYSTTAELSADVSGIIFFRNGEPFIAANSKDSLKRKLFTLAHELGHFLLHPLQEGERYRLDKYYSVDDYNKEETEANYFAASLLVPSERLAWAMNQSGDTSIIARYFGVNEAVIINRMRWLKYNG